MAFDSFAAFIAMGEHGVFVWSAYAMFLLVMIANVAAPGLRRRSVMARLRRLERRREGPDRSRPDLT